MGNTLVWSEIPVTDMKKAKTFYSALFESELQENNEGPNPMIMLPFGPDNVVSGHIYPGKPAPAGTGNTLHLSVPGTLDAAKKRIADAGGTVVSDTITIESGSFFYAMDPEGNSIGIFEG